MEAQSFLRVMCGILVLVKNSAFLFSFLTFLGIDDVIAQPDSVWVRGYPGTMLYGGDVVGDAMGNVYVAGRSFDNNGDFLVIKYNASGQLQWARTYNGPSNFVDQPSAITVDNAGNVIVTGYDYSFSTGSDFCTIKYNPNGDSLWIRRHNGYPPSTAEEVATALVTDDSGNVYVTGYGPGPSSAADVFTIKYSPGGDSLWGQYYNFPATNGGDHGWAITLDNDGNVIVVGDSWGGTQIPPATNYDYLVLKYSSNGTPLYVRRQAASPGTGSDVARAVAIDTAGNIYVTGWAQEGAWYIATFRFNSFTDSIWQQNFTTNALQGRKIARDGSGSLYIVGDTYDPHWLTLKYSIAGALQWSRVYSNGGYAADMALDAVGNVYVAGNVYGTFGGAYGVLKYSAAGDSLWLRIHDNASGDDILAAMHSFGVDDFVVTGSATGQGQIVTVRYSTPVNVPQSIEILPGHFALSQNYPNPFNASTVIRYSLPVSRYVMLRVFDFLGREVATLVDGAQPAGEHSVQWKSADEPSGVYIYRLTAGEFVATKKLLLLK